MISGLDAGDFNLLVPIKELGFVVTNELQGIRVFALDPQDLLIDILDGARKCRQGFVANTTGCGLSHSWVILRQANRRCREYQKRQAGYPPSVIHHDLLLLKDATNSGECNIFQLCGTFTAMEKSGFSRTVVFLLLAAVAAFAADVSGKWVAQVPGRNGQAREVTFNLKADGSSLTGTVSGRGGDNPISDGKIDGDNISFTQTLEFNGNSVKLIYKGKMSGDEIKFTRQREGGEGQGAEFTAKRGS